jgi:hypothetical protein
MGRQLCKVWNESEADGRDHLRKFWIFSRSLLTLLEGLLRKMLYPKDDAALFHL